jgi:SHS2 domain-containing protein
MSDAYGSEDHTADLALWLQAETLPGLFALAVRALAEVMVVGQASGAGRPQGEITWLPVSLEGQDEADLLVQLLNEAVYRLDGEGLLAVAWETSALTLTCLEGRLGVLAFDPARQERGEPVKAVTYHQARIEAVGQGFRAHLVLDV